MSPGSPTLPGVADLGRGSSRVTQITLTTLRSPRTAPATASDLSPHVAASSSYPPPAPRSAIAARPGAVDLRKQEDLAHRYKYLSVTPPLFLRHPGPDRIHCRPKIVFESAIISWLDFKGAR